MLNAGFQYLEQRDANDTITKDGVVGKNSPFATSDNSGIYDIIAENLRWLKENVDDVKDTSDLEAIKQSVTDMYNEMKNNSSFGATAAKAQAEEAKKQAQAALESATNAKTYYDDITNKSTEVNDTIAEIKTYIEKAEALNKSNKELEQSIADHATVATNKANEASDSATNAATSSTNAKTSETNAKASETAAKTSETNAKQYEADAKAHMDATATSASNAKASETHAKTSETNSKTSEVNAKVSETHAKTSETNASNSADLSKAWAESKNSPDTMNDTDSTTGKTQSSKSWAIYSKDRAISAFKSETNAKASETAAKTSETNAKTSETNAATSASNAATSESHAKTSETNAKVSETNAKTSETNASTSKSNAATSETNAKSYMDTAKEYMQKAQEALAAAQAIQSIVDTAKANAEKCLADVEAVKNSLAKMITYQGSVDNYSDLPTNPQVGYSYNVKNADKTHGVNAGDNLVWNGEDWDNLGGSVDMSLFAELGKDVRFNAVTATTFTGNLKGTADRATADANGNELADPQKYMHVSYLDNADFNDIRTTGVYTCMHGTYTNTPVNSWGVLRVYQIKNSSIKQEYILENKPEVYVRYCVAGTWDAWSKVNAGNADYATNADTVDGVHATSLFYNKGDWADDNWATTGTYQVYNTAPVSGAYPYGQVISSSTAWARFQLFAPQKPYKNKSGDLYYRTGWIDDKQPWKAILDSENYTNYVPNQLQRNKAYAVGDIAYSPNLPSWAYLECVTAGTTGSTEPDFSSVSSTGGQ